jgi:hypothetical protein
MNPHLRTFVLAVSAVALAGAATLAGAAEKPVELVRPGATSTTETQSSEGRSLNPVLGRETGIESKDSCQLTQTERQVRAAGDCPGGKTCTLQERRKLSTQPWKNAAANPQPPESQMEYRPDCI